MGFNPTYQTLSTLPSLAEQTADFSMVILSLTASELCWLCGLERSIPFAQVKVATTQSKNTTLQVNGIRKYKSITSELYLKNEEEKHS